MRVGVLSDVHANLHALDEALHRLVFFHHVHRIVCLGDVVEKAPPGTPLCGGFTRGASR